VPGIKCGTGDTQCGSSSKGSEAFLILGVVQRRDGCSLPRWTMAAWCNQLGGSLYSGICVPLWHTNVSVFRFYMPLSMFVFGSLYQKHVHGCGLVAMGLPKQPPFSLNTAGFTHTLKRPGNVS
jgi:hypothetical protein